MIYSLNQMRYIAWIRDTSKGALKVYGNFKTLNQLLIIEFDIPGIPLELVYFVRRYPIFLLIKVISFLSSTEYECRYVTCDFSVWSSWSTSCGTGMKRKRTLTRQNEHIIEQQGGCSGLTTSCQTEEVETKNSLCEYCRREPF